MNKNKFFVFLMIVVFSFSLFSLPVFALTKSEVEGLIQMGFIPPDKVAIARSLATPDPVVKTNTTNTSINSSAGKISGSCVKLSTDIVMGMSGSAVTALQNFLRDQKYLNIETATGYFGEMTKQAVEKFQTEKGIEAIGRVGPTTRKTIEQMTCVDGVTGTLSSGSASSTNDFFGYDLDALLNGFDVDLNFDPQFDYDSGAEFQAYFDYEADFGYKADFKYKLDDDYDVDLDYDLGKEYKADFNYSLSGQDPIVVALYVKAVNGEYLRGGNSLPVAVSSRNIEVKWKSENADECVLSGDFPEREKDVPEDGSASVYLVNPSYEASNGDPMFGLRISCKEDDLYGDFASDIALIWIASSTASN